MQTGDVKLSKRPLVSLAIPCFDRTKAQPLPVYTKLYWLDWDNLSAEEAMAIESYIAKREKSRKSPAIINENTVVVSEEIGNVSDLPFVREKRHLFSPIENNDLERLAKKQNLKLEDGFISLILGTDYFETESEQPITICEMLQHTSGHEQPLILGAVQSVISMGCTPPKQDNILTNDNINILAQYIDIVEQIAKSKWLQSQKKLTYEAGDIDGSQTLEALFPDEEDTMVILAYIRQLHASDRLLERAGNIYLSSCSDERKIVWAQERINSFIYALDRPPLLLSSSNEDNTVRKIIRMFMYGAGLLHSESQYNEKQKLNDFISKHGKHRSVFMLNHCLVTVYKYAADLYYPLKQDLCYWIDNRHISPPSRYQISNLFQKLV